MNYRGFKALYLSERVIKKKADSFREKYWNDAVPVNIEAIIERKLDISIVPYPGLKEKCDADAFISSNWKEVIVDNDLYMDDRYQNRLRFSLAHEVGHFVLHKEIYSFFKIKRVEDFYEFHKEIPQEEYWRFENQAQKFAGHLLIPEDKLIAKRRALLERSELKGYLKRESADIKMLNSYLAKPLALDFGVSEEAM
jgi:Zn-dependent peptidase ImmA (M78 family)